MRLQYLSRLLTTVARTVANEKILEMENKNGRWLIVSEDSALHE